jgi:ADP-heptose:LPS heptosyltransferase
MNVSLLQKVDRCAGVPLCWALTLARKLFGRPPLPGPTPVRRLLFVKLAEQGSTVLAVPAISRAAQLVGRQNIYFIVFSENRFILDFLELLPPENVIVVSRKNFSQLVFTTLKAIRQLRRLKLDAAIDLEFFARGSAAVAFLSGARARVGFHAPFGAGPYRGDLMTHRLLYNPHLHTTSMFQVLVESLRLDPAQLPTFPLPPPPSENVFRPFEPRAGEREEVQALLPKSNGASAPVILLNPNASDLIPLRQWPTARYIELARRLLAQWPEVCVVFTGGNTEAPETARLAAEVRSERCVSLAGKTTLRQLMVLYSVAEILVTNDSGPAHFASMTSINVIALFGPETPALFAARTPRNLALWAGISCSPCVNAYNNRQSACRDNVCMQLITLDQVFAEVCRIYLARRKNAERAT